MEKILVEVYIPVSQRTFDVFIPPKSRLGEILALLKKIAPDLSSGYFAAGPDTVLCSRGEGVIYNLNMTAQELGLENGARLMLI